GDTIRRIRDLLRTVHGMEQEASRIRGAVDLLQQARQQADDYLDLWLERTGLEYAAAAQIWRQNQRQYLSAKDEQQQLAARLAACADEQRLTGERLDQAHHELVQLEARRQGIPALHSRDQLQDRQQQLQQWAGHHSVGLELPHLTSRSWREASQAVLSAEQQPVADLNQLLARDWIDLSPLDSGLDAIRAQQHSHNQLAAHLQQPLAE